MEMDVLTSLNSWLCWQGIGKKKDENSIGGFDTDYP
jgi:hypothetical protein